MSTKEGNMNWPCESVDVDNPKTPKVNKRYLWQLDHDRPTMEEGICLERSVSGHWVKMFDGKYAKWYHVDELLVLEELRQPFMIFEGC